MRKFVTGGVAFYMLDEGERLTNAELYHTYHYCGYVIWPKGDKWDVREMGLRGWEKMTDRLFNTENEAFVFAYEKHCADDERSRRG